MDTFLMIPSASNGVHDTGVEEDNDGEETSAYEYAQLNNLVSNHCDPPPFSYLKILSIGLANELTDDVNLPQFAFHDHIIAERLEVTKETAELLTWLGTVTRENSIDNPSIPNSNDRKIKTRRIALPILRSDHDLDCTVFGQREKFEIKLRDVRFPQEIVDDTKNEGLVLSNLFWDKEEELIGTIKKEKVAAPKEAMQFLMNALKLDWTVSYWTEVWQGMCTYKKNRTFEPVTPPLFAITPDYTPYEPSLSDPVFEVPLTSDPASLTNDDLMKIERQMFDQDNPTPIRSAKARQGKEIGLYTDREGVDEVLECLELSPTTPTTSPRQRASKFKVEQTLTPRDDTSSAKSVHFSEIIQKLHHDSPSPNNSDAAFESHFFEEAFREVAAIAVKRTEQESLIEADTTARVQVPILDFSRPEPPWNTLQQLKYGTEREEAQRKFLSEQISGAIPKWPVQQVYTSMLKWNPFPHDLAKVVLEEEIIRESSTESILHFPEIDNVIDTSSLTWKRPGLKILNESDDDEDDTEPGVFPQSESQDLAFIVKKRKLVIEQEKKENVQPAALSSLVDQSDSYKIRETETMAALHETQKPDGSVSLSHPTSDKVQRKGNKEPSTKAQVPRRQDDELKLGQLLGAFSAGVSLNNFLEIRGVKRPKLSDSSYFAPVLKPISDPSVISQSEEAAIELSIRRSPILPDLGLPIPSYQKPVLPSSIIVSSNFLRRRSLVKQIEALCPGIKMCERDFDAFNTTTWMQNSVHRSPIASLLAAEADIIISASTGIVITTLPKIKQKPLPGQKTKVAIREKIEKVSVRYEKLIVLVGDGQKEEDPLSLDEGSCQAIAEFMGFVQAFETSITVHLVGGGESTLSKWLVCCIVKYGAREPMEFLEEQTHWELFLRRAGLNAFAAQAIIAQLKAPDGVNSQSSSKAGLYGLTAFIEMGKEHRLAKFGSLCGHALIERVSDLIDTRWNVG